MRKERPAYREVQERRKLRRRTGRLRGSERIKRRIEKTKREKAFV